jgi:DNA-binding response OmpR family regulator
MAQHKPEILGLREDKCAGRRVLIVDHDENALSIIKRLLEEAMYETTTAQSGLKALQLLSRGTFELVLLDDNLMDLSGEEIVRQVRSVGTGTPVVVMQSVPHSHDRAVQYARLGACFFTDRSNPKAIAELVHDHFSRTHVCGHFSCKV